MRYALEVQPAAVETIMTLAPESADGRETGGILLGRGPLPDGLIVIEQAGDAGAEAIRRPNFFLRDRAHAESLALSAWKERQAVWVGDWHTHPVGGPHPSHRDLRTYAGLLAAAELEFLVFVSIIVVPDVIDGWRTPQLHPWLLDGQQST
ncbi:MAG TPA: Mov34/MPN/PAD-1 family protein [Solirubrobacter sp.]|nr:Mov34/MPN/PAD-1 family protein [Solirubrobacter sp.]